MTRGATNRLINSTSPYLLQHAHNPVDWFEWGEEALMKAKKENKPILVSIGYSSCHWCHVMEREVFEKENMAELMNKYLVCIKVDREERPDIDQIYMDAVQAMGIQGGWPLNVFLTPDQKPFYGGTYFPPANWVKILDGIHQAFTTRRDEVEESASQFSEHLRQNDTQRFKREADVKDLSSATKAIYTKLEPLFDRTWGGLDKAPKFVMPSLWQWLLRYHYLTKDESALQQLNVTLQRVAMGGIYDQIAGGFARYSVDGYWFAPHFEKMLYDNAQLLSLYAEAYTLTKDESYKQILIETAQWLQSEMMHPEGGFFSALDADSEGVEGKFYVWTKEEFDSILGDQADLIGKYYSLKPEGNWEHGNNILFRAIQENTFLDKSNLDKNNWKKILNDAKDKLLATRDKRIRPGLDDKIITGWNGMMSAGLCDAFRATGDERFLKLALRNLEFIERELSQGTTLYRTFKGKRSTVHGFLDDYAFIIQACIRLYQNTFQEYWLRRAEAYMSHVIDEFLDSEDGFFFYAGKYGEKLIAQKKEVFDNVIPSSNAVTAQNLYHLGVLLDRSEWKSMSERMVTSLGYLITQEPNYMSYWAMVYQEVKKGMAEVVIVGPEMKERVAEFVRTFEPFSLMLGAEVESATLPLLEGKILKDNKTTIYVCSNNTCRSPVHSTDAALKELHAILG